VNLEAITNQSPSEGAIYLHFVGDIMLSRKVGEKIISAGPKFILDPIQNIIGKSDLLCGNLESPISENVVKSGGFKAPVLAVEIIKHFDVVTLANNHIFDCGDKGIEDTIEILTKNGIRYVGIGETEDVKPVIFTIKGKKIAVLGCSSDELFERIPSTKYFILSVSDKRMPGIIEETKKEADFIVMMFHGGEEFIPYPPPSVRKSLKNLIYSGVDFVVGHHPHVLGGYESARDDTLIWYSLGDFVFDSLVEERRRGGILAIKIDETSSVSFELIPTYIDDSLRVVPAPDSLAKTILGNIESYSQKLKEANYERQFPKLYYKQFLKFEISRLCSVFKYEGFWGTIRFLLSHIKYVRFYTNKFTKRAPGTISENRTHREPC
jgi:poly-gamma-glutamate capsule biosynthesis protein CapA/YwtB (metallophosphatase superfamily)